MALSFVEREGWLNAKLGELDGTLLYHKKEFRKRDKADSRMTWLDFENDGGKRPAGGELGYIWYCGFCHRKVDKFSMGVKHWKTSHDSKIKSFGMMVGANYDSCPIKNCIWTSGNSRNKLSKHMKSLKSHSIKELYENGFNPWALVEINSPMAKYIVERLIRDGFVIAEKKKEAFCF